MLQTPTTPAERAIAAYEALADGREEGPRHMGTPVIFWTVGDRSANGRGAGCANTVDICLTVRGPDAGTVRSGRETLEAHRADEAATLDFDDRVAWALRNGYEPVAEERSADRMVWVGRRMSRAGDVVTHTVEAVRGPARPDDEAVLAFAALLRQHRPPLPGR